MKLFLIVIFWLILLQSSAQSNIDGKYLWSDASGSTAKMLQFNRNDVIFTSYPDSGDSVVLKGTYVFKNKVIQLSFDEPKILSTLLIKEDTSNQNLNTKLVKLKILDGENNNIPFFNASVIIKTCDNSNLFLFSDSTGSINYITNDVNLKSFKVISLGYDILTIPINSNYGTVEVECVLRLSRYNGLGIVPKLMSKTKNNDLIDNENAMIYKKIK